MPNRLSAISRWKIFDNLRRSLVEIAQLAMLIVGWFLLPTLVIKWTAIVLITIAFPWLFSLAISLMRPPRDQSWLAYYLAVSRDAITNVQQFALALVFLPHQAVVSADAIMRTLYRLFISHRKLLEWQTASQVERAMGVGSQLETWRKMWPVTALCIVLAALIGLEVTVGGVASSDERFLFVMGTLPLVLAWLASPSIAFALSSPAILGEIHLTEAERQASLRYAKLHWMYFEKFVSEETHWLAPDNFQEDPEPILALRTSPTNIGLQLLSTVSAVDLGFITRSDMIDRVEKVFRSLERMRRFHGHFFNWYDLNELRVLEPAYVSTVDSGNLAGHLIALKQACFEMMKDPSCAELDAKRLRAIAERAHAYAVEMDFRFLYDTKRKLFTIGYHIGSNTVDNSYYDLLASESRLASFIAIAKDDVSVDHWFRLGRSLTAAAGTRTLLSWSGSMFEYLMPALVMQTFPFTLLDQTHKGSVRRQIAYGAERGVPWGVSESAYAVRDRLHTYQYRGFGVPDLALKRGLSKELVVAPYATVLAMLVEPRQSLKNLTTLEAEGALGPYGFRDALDYTRPSPGSRKTIVCTFMAHHIGMSIVALNNALNRQIWPRRFHLDPLVRSAELVLQERIPRRLTVQDVQGDDAARVPSEMEKPAVREVETPHTPQPVVGILGNVPYTTLITNAGGGFSRYGNLAVTRWRHDSTRDNYGQWCYIKDLSTGHVWSTAHQPTGTEPQWYRVLFASDRITFIRRDGDIDTVTEIAVASDDAAEVRRVVLTNRALQAREIELTSYSEIVLAPPDADRAHPAFQNLFVQTEFLEGKAAILATRRPRSATEASIWCAHVVATGPEVVGKITCETDRAKFVGRGRSVRNAEALDEGAELTGTVGAVLDPIFSLRVRVRIPPGASVSIAFTTFVTEQKERAIELADLYHDPYSARRALDLSWAQAQAELRDLGIAPADAALYQDLAGHLMFPHPGFRPAQSAVEENRLGQQALWALGISGDWPILLATIESGVGMPSVRQLLRTHHYWRLKGIACDLVILNMHPATYMQELSDELLATTMASSEAGLLDRPGGVFVRRADLLKPEEITLLKAMARVQVNCDGLGLGNFLEFPGVEDRYPPKLEIMNRDIVPLGTVPIHAAKPDPGTGLQHFNGLGGFNTNGEYEIHLTGSDLPPAPWINVVGNEVGGFLVSEGGSGTTWAGNSFFFRITPWHNDPVRDPSSDCVFLRDDTNGDLWTATPCPIREPTPYQVRHGAGYTVFDHDHKGIASSLRLGVDQTDPVKISVLTLWNNGATRKKLTLTWYLEWVLGVTREKTQYQVRTEFDEETQSMFARNYFDADFAENGRLRIDQRACRLLYRRPARVPRQKRDDLESGRARARGIVGSNRRDDRSVLRAAGERDARAGRDARHRDAPGCGRERRSREANHRTPSHVRRGEALGRLEHQGLGKKTRDDQGTNAGADIRPDGESVGSVPGALLPNVGTVRVVSVERRIRIPRSAAGRNGFRLYRSGDSKRAHRASGVTPVRRGRCSALVAPADGTRRAHALLGRSGVAPVCDRPLRHGYVRRASIRRRDPVSHDAAAQSGRARDLRDAEGFVGNRKHLRSLCSRAEESMHQGSARTSADRQRRLERRNEPGRHRGEGRECVARVVPHHDAAEIRGARRRSAAIPRCATKSSLEGRWLC